jgi:hypothetical protein
MTYTPTVWANETPASSPVKFKITDDVGGVLANSAKIELVTSVTPGTPVNATNLNKLEAGVQTAQATAEGAAGFVMASVSGSVSVGGSGSAVAMTFATEHLDTASMVNLTSYPTRVTIAAGYSGWYQVTAQVQFNGAVGTTVTLDVSGTPIDFVFSTSPAVFYNITRLAHLTAGTVLELWVAQTSGSTRTAYGALDVVLMKKD